MPDFSMLRWGLLPTWSTSPTHVAPLINARGETVADKPAFRDPWWKKRRCIVPADGFYEWQSNGGARQPFYIAPRDDLPLAFAGLWDGWKDPETGLWLRTFTILTCPANATLRAVHERMPVVLAIADIASFLTDDDPRHLLRPAPDDMLVARPVSAAVNSVRNDGPGLIETRPLAPTASQ